MLITVKNKDTLKLDDYVFRCSIGKNGITSKKKKEINVHHKVNLNWEHYIIELIELKNLKQILQLKL